MKISFIRPNYPHETRVAILPEGVSTLVKNGIQPIIETGFGRSMNLSDADYASAGSEIRSREDCYKERVVFNLKLTQPSDYGFLRSDHILVGWSHPNVTGNIFYREVSAPLGTTLVDIDSVTPRIFRGAEAPETISFFPRHMFWKNSYNAGIASVRLASKYFSLVPSSEAHVCVLGSGSVSQGAFHELSRLGFVPRMFYRKTLPIFRELVKEYELIVNGIEVDNTGTRIMERSLLERTREDVRIVDAAADADNAIWGTKYLTLERPVAQTAGRDYLLVTNTPTIMTEDASRDISAVVTRDIVPNLAMHRKYLGF